MTSKMVFVVHKRRIYLVTHTVRVKLVSTGMIRYPMNSSSTSNSTKANHRTEVSFQNLSREIFAKFQTTRHAWRNFKFFIAKFQLVKKLSTQIWNTFYADILSVNFFMKLCSAKVMVFS